MTSKNTQNSTPAKDVSAKETPKPSNTQSKDNLPTGKDAKGQPTQPGKDLGKSQASVPNLDPKQEEMMKKKTGKAKSHLLIPRGHFGFVRTSGRLRM